MKPVKRVELIIDAMDVEELLNSLKNIGIKHYTLINGAYGKGDRGERGGDIFSGAFNNSYVLIACNEDEAKELVEITRPMLKKLGGVCMVSDAMWVKH